MTSERGKGRSWLQRSVLALNVVLIVTSLASAWTLWLIWNRAESINRVALGRSLTAIPADVEPGQRVINVLLVGSDSSAGLDPSDPVQIDRQGERFGDVIIIAHIDERSGSVALLSLPRDLWVEIGDTGREGRINRAFVNGGAAGLIDTIERQFDIPINHYANVDFAGFRGLVEAIDSVDVWFPTPARDWNINARPVPRTQTGFLVSTAGCHSLDAETALAYVRSRYYQTKDESGQWRTDPTADLGRNRRQQDFLRRALSRAIEVGARNPFVLRDLIDTGLEHVAIDQDLTPQLLVDLGATLRSFEPDQLQTYSFPNTPTTIGANQVLLPRTEEAAALLELFRGARFDAPSTVDLRVLVASSDLIEPDESDEWKELVAALGEAGFDTQLSEGSNDLPVGVVVRHGPDGAAAAALVVDAIERIRIETRAVETQAVEWGVTVEEVSGLTGRTVELSLGVPSQSSPVVTAPPQPEVAGEVAVEETTQPGLTIEPEDDGKMSAEEMCG